ncbi:hypothetical protein [Nocardia altamirensis]|uniref:hypothetical protein n=1 Tax=Nocardia altamirensis TaxID=472158 RepID=UPI0014355AD0|nr:hypothetical protein [Nocardia altamirensis]
MTELRYADGTRVCDHDVELLARAFGFASARAWFRYHHAAEERRRQRRPQAP